MSDYEETPSPTSPGAIRASAEDRERRANERIAGSGVGDPMRSGVTSGAEGVMPQGAVPGGTSMESSDSKSMQENVKEKVDRAKEQTDRVVDTASQKAHEVTDQATKKTDAGIDKAAGGLHSLADTIRERGQSMGEGQVQSVATTAAEKLEAGATMLEGQSTEELITQLEGLIRRKPAQSLLVAAGAGFVLSKALR